MDLNRDFNPDLKEGELTLFWKRRTRGASYWSLAVNTSQFFSALNSTISPDSETQQYIAPVYLVTSIIAYICLYLYWFKKRNTAYPVLGYIIIRTCIRLFDFENTRDLKGENEWF